MDIIGYKWISRPLLHPLKTTSKAHLKRLAEQEYLLAIGKGRGARYTQKKRGI